MITALALAMLSPDSATGVGVVPACVMKAPYVAGIAYGRSCARSPVSVRLPLRSTLPTHCRRPRGGECAFPVVSPTLIGRHRPIIAAAWPMASSTLAAGIGVVAGGITGSSSIRAYTVAGVRVRGFPSASGRCSAVDVADALRRPRGGVRVPVVSHAVGRHADRSGDLAQWRSSTLPAGNRRSCPANHGSSKHPRYRCRVRSARFQVSVRPLVRSTLPTPVAVPVGRGGDRRVPS